MDPQYEEKVEGGVFTLTFRASKQLLLHPEFEQMVWDECLRRAHASGHMPVGPIFIETAEIESIQESLTEGNPLIVNPMAMGGVVSVNMMRVTAQVQLGLSLD